ASTRSSAFSGVRYGAKIQIAVRCNRPSASALKRTGKRRAARAAWMRFAAASSDRRSSSTQKANMDEYPAGTYSRRASTSAMFDSNVAQWRDLEPRAWRDREEAL